MDTVCPDFRISPPRLSPGVLAAVILLHAVLLSAIISLPDTAEETAPAAPLFVRLIAAPAPPPEPVAPIQPTPIQPAPLPPVKRAEPPPVIAAPPAPPRPAPAPLPQRQVQPVEPARPEPARAEPAAVATPAPVATPSPAPAVPVPAAVEAPRPAPAPPPPLPVIQPRFNADYLDNPKPTYPPMSRRLGEEGEVRLRVHVSATGQAQQVELYRSSGYPRLDQAAQETVRQWRFVPARQGDQPVAAWVIVPIQFVNPSQ